MNVTPIPNYLMAMDIAFAVDCFVSYYQKEMPELKITQEYLNKVHDKICELISNNEFYFRA